MGCARAKMILSAVTTVWLIVCAPRLASSDIAVHCAEVPTQVYLGELPNAMFLHPRGLGDRTRPSRSYQRPLSQHHDATGPIWSGHSILHSGACTMHSGCERSLVGLSDVRLMVALPLSSWGPALNISPPSPLLLHLLLSVCIHFSSFRPHNCHQ